MSSKSGRSGPATAVPPTTAPSVATTGTRRDHRCAEGDRIIPRWAASGDRSHFPYNRHPGNFSDLGPTGGRGREGVLCMRQRIKLLGLVMPLLVAVGPNQAVSADERSEPKRMVL